jgi:hypothetical protein
MTTRTNNQRYEEAVDRNLGNLHKESKTRKGEKSYADMDLDTIKRKVGIRANDKGFDKEITKIFK